MIGMPFHMSRFAGLAIELDTQELKEENIKIAINNWC
jgi:hypothetical protein